MYFVKTIFLRKGKQIIFKHLNLTVILSYVHVSATFINIYDLKKQYRYVHAIDSNDVITHTLQIFVYIPTYILLPGRQ